MNKTPFLQLLRAGLLELGFWPSPINQLRSMALFVKPLRKGFVLTLGVQNSKLYKDRFTGAYCLSKSFLWGYLLPDMPREAYQRVGHFLHTDERARLLANEYCRPGVVDAWWHGLSEENAASFVTAVKLTLPRIESNQELIAALDKSESLQRHRELVQATVKRAKSEVPGAGRKIPPAYELAAREAIAELGSPYEGAAYAKLIATDAWLTSLAAERAAHRTQR